jgi:hypothetical protein
MSVMELALSSNTIRYAEKDTPLVQITHSQTCFLMGHRDCCPAMFLLP